MSATSTSGTANQAGFAPLASLRLRLPLICISVNITLEQQVRRLDPVIGEDPHAVVGQLLHRDFEVPASERGNIAAEPGDLLIDEPSLLVEAFHEKLNAPRAGAIHVLHATAHDRCAIPLPRLPIDLEVPFPPKANGRRSVEEDPSVVVAADAQPPMTSTRTARTRTFLTPSMLVPPISSVT